MRRTGEEKNKREKEKSVTGGAHPVAWSDMEPIEMMMMRMMRRRTKRREVEGR
jgi:hypothetical protein